MNELEALVPSLPDQFVVPEGKVYPPEGTVIRGRVAVFAGCIMSTVFAETDRATVRVLNASGYEVVVPEQQGCCGALGIHAGEMEDARGLARRNIAAFERSGAEAIIVNAAGCGSTLKEYGHLFEDDPEWSARARAFSERIRDVTEFLGDLLTQDKLNTTFQPLNITVTFQEPCHLVHAQRISRQPRALLKAIPGLTLVEMEESAVCCGSAGIYNLVRPQMARQLGDRKAKNAIATDAQAVVTANPGCHLQVRASLERNGSPLPVIHIVDLLDAAYRGHMPV
jgi:glycolate oxidase iron-sulfur subunit